MEGWLEMPICLPSEFNQTIWSIAFDKIVENRAGFR